MHVCNHYQLGNGMDMFRALEVCFRSSSRISILLATFVKDLTDSAKQQPSSPESNSRGIHDHEGFGCRWYSDRSAGPVQLQAGPSSHGMSPFPLSLICPSVDESDRAGPARICTICGSEPPLMAPYGVTPISPVAPEPYTSRNGSANDYLQGIT